MDDEENRVTPIASGSSAFSLHRASTQVSAASSQASSSLLYQQPFLYPKQGLNPYAGVAVLNTDDIKAQDPDNTDGKDQQLDVRELERELRPVSALTPVNIQRPVPVTPVVVAPAYSEDSLEDDDIDDFTVEENKLIQRRRQRWKKQMKHAKKKRQHNVDENGCVTMFPQGMVSALQNELVDVLDKIGQGCGSLVDSDDDDDEDEEEDDDGDSGLSDEEETTAYSTSQTRSGGGGALALRAIQESFSDITARTRYQMKDQKFLRTFISTLTQSGVIVLHHKAGVARPTKCLAFLQQGFNENGRYRAPLLVWKPVEEEGGGCIVDLFSILSVDKAAPMHLKRYPLAMPGRTVSLETNEEVVLELRSEQDAYRFVHGMRWIIARLSFNLIIGNLSVSCEMLDVGRKENCDRFGLSPSNSEEESQWMAAMNDVTCELVSHARDS